MGDLRSVHTCLILCKIPNESLAYFFKLIVLKTAWNKLKYFKPREIFLLTEYPGTIEESFQYTDLQSRFWPTYYQFFGSCCQETEKFLANLCFKRREHSVQTADDNIKVISQAF